VWRGRGQAREGRWGQVNVGRGIFGLVVVDGGVVVWRFVGWTADCDVVIRR